MSIARQQEKIRQKIVSVFAEYGLKITIYTNLKIVNFLDVTFNLENEICKPYRRPGDRPLYVNNGSNHPPQILKNLPRGIEQRLVQNSCSEEIFLQAIPDYQKELDRCGYTYKLGYNKQSQTLVQPSTGRKRKARRVTWFNSPLAWMSRRTWLVNSWTY